MAYQTLITIEELLPHLDDSSWVVVDCRFSLADIQEGKRNYFSAHITGAVYAHLNEDLSGVILPGKTGRHPLPPVEKLSETFSAWGISEGVQVVTYDDRTGAIAAARLWWLLKWLGHAPVAVLEGGLQNWLSKGYPVRSGEEKHIARLFTPSPRWEMLVDSEAVERVLYDHAYRLIDARSADRYRGENETIDPVAGHIPGALSKPYGENLKPDGMFKTTDDIRSEYRLLLDDVPTNQVIAYCGSGVTAAHTILTMAHAGMGMARLYVGSWSEWITDPKRPIA